MVLVFSAYRLTLRSWNVTGSYTSIGICVQCRHWQQRLTYTVTGTSPFLLNSTHEYVLVSELLVFFFVCAYFLALICCLVCCLNHRNTTIAYSRLLLNQDTLIKLTLRAPTRYWARLWRDGSRIYLRGRIYLKQEVRVNYYEVMQGY